MSDAACFLSSHLNIVSQPVTISQIIGGSLAFLIPGNNKYGKKYFCPRKFSRISFREIFPQYPERIQPLYSGYERSCPPWKVTNFVAKRLFQVSYSEQIRVQTACRHCLRILLLDLTCCSQLFPVTNLSGEFRLRDGTMASQFRKECGQGREY